MAIDLDLFSGSNYRSTISRYCNSLGWRINDINNHRTIIKFGMNSGSTQTLFIIRYGNTLEFSCPSGLKFDSAGDVPAWLSAALLCKNREYKVGFWCLEVIEGRQALSIMHNAEISLIDVNYFGSIIDHLVKECDDLEQTVARALRGR